MNERLIALADAADAVCSGCRNQKPLFNETGDDDFQHGKGFWTASTCRADRIRVLVGILGTKPTSEWRKP